VSVLHAPTYRWTVEEYEELGRAGFFQGDKRVELLHGQIVSMPRISWRHAAALVRLNEFFILHSLERFVVGPRNPFNLDERSQPEPDLVLLDPACNTLRRHPTPAEIFVVIEVSDSTVAYDRKDKGPAYARNGVREYWMLNLDENVLEVFREPSADGYRDTRVLGRDDTIAPLAFPDLTLRVGDFLP